MARLRGRNVRWSARKEGPGGGFRCAWCKCFVWKDFSYETCLTKLYSGLGAWRQPHSAYTYVAVSTTAPGMRPPRYLLLPSLKYRSTAAAGMCVARHSCGTKSNVPSARESKIR